MYEKPHLMTRSHSFEVGIQDEYADQLLKGLKDAGFKAELLKETVGFEDLNSDADHEHVAFIELPEDTDKLKLRKFLRDWKA